MAESSTILFTNSQEYLNKIAEDFIKNAQEELISNNSVVTGRLSRSIKAEEGKQLSPTLYSVIVEYLQYGEYVDDGAERRAGKQPPVKPLMEWIRLKSIKVPQGLTVESFAYAIAKNIAKKGQRFKKPKPWIAPSWDQAFKENEQKYAVAVLKDINNTIVERYRQAGYEVTTTR